MGFVAPSISLGNAALSFATFVKCTIGLNRIVLFHVFWHGQRKGCKREVGEARRVGREPGGVGRAAVGWRGRPTKGVLLGESKGEGGEPGVVGARGTDPDRAGMVNVDRAVGGLIGSVAEGRRDREFLLGFADFDGGFVLEQSRKYGDPVGCVEHLCGFEEHFHNVFIGVVARSFAGMAVENKDVHCAGG